MEAASLLAVAQVRGISFGQILYAGDDLSGEWDRRGWSNRTEIRENLFWLAADGAIGNDGRFAYEPIKDWLSDK